MKKLFLTLIGFLLLSTTVFGSDVLFKMTATTTSNASNTDTGADLDLASYYYYYVGGSALVHNGQISSAKLVDAGIARITDNEGYIKVTLPTGVTLQTGDVIKYTGNSDESSKNILLHKLGGNTAGGRSGAAQVAHNTEYALKSTDAVVGENVFYINLGASVSGSNYIKNFTISRPNELVKFYSFESLNPVNYETTTTEGNVIVEEELYINSDGTSGSGANGIKSVSGKPQAIYMRGKGENRAIMLNVTDPCQIEIWGWSAKKALGVSEGAYNQTTIDAHLVIDNTSDASDNIITRGEYNYTGFEDNKTIYIAPKEGAFYVAAIRVVYNKIRPVADLSVDKTAITIRTGYKDSVIVTTTSTVAIERSRNRAGDGGVEDLVSISEKDEKHKIIITGKKAGNYYMVLSQAASADYRAASVETQITIANSVNIDASIASNTGTISGGTENNGPVWTASDGNITLIYTGSEGSNWIRPFSNGQLSNGLSLVKNYSYTISVPSNKKIKSVTFTGYTNDRGTAETPPNKTKIEVNSSASASELPYIGASGNENEVGSIEYTSLNTNTFTFKVLNCGMGAVINLVVEDANTYPVTFGNNWASFCAPEDVELPNGVTAYYASANDAETITVNRVESTLIKKNTGVLLYSETLPSCNLTATTGAAAIEGNILRYTNARTARNTSGTTYALNSDEGYFQEYTGNYIPANKAYVYIAAAGAPQRLRIVQATEVTTGVEETQESLRYTKVIENGQLLIIRDGVKYNIQGQIIK